MKEEITLKLVQIQLQFKFLHWQTFGDAKHKAYGEIYDSMGDNIDRLVESMMGKYGRIQFDSEFSIMFQDISALSVQNFMDGITEFLNQGDLIIHSSKVKNNELEIYEGNKYVLVAYIDLSI